MKRVAPALMLGVVIALYPAPALAQANPHGTYISQEGQDPLAISRNAGVEISFVDGRYEMRRDGELRVIGRYRLHADTLFVADVEGVWACTTAETSAASYRWHANADQLKFTVVGEDLCNRRRNRIAGVTFIRGRVPPAAPTVQAPPELRDSWQKFWLQSDVAGWIDHVFSSDAVAEDGNRRLVGIEQIRQWLGGQDSRSPQAFPFEFSKSGSRIIEKGRYRDVFGSPDGSTRILVGRYQITWLPSTGSSWKVQEWILR